ncbi:hypothetical protein LVD15_12000 [Fulvivirga maritima]|uniref:hypothetical protein n=1 Tax=Fulvivirga maritima TaxID=2904247 RepID=UPI001F27F652|nr:hypothetical protein [Fulvivirga maritima]UII29118.1 hypothetical protein LVD15_12000 [Fulvivirga maritima]
MTNELPTFELQCQDFNKDQEEFERISIYKTKKYGLEINNKGFLKELLEDKPEKIRLTNFVPILKPRKVSELPSVFHVTKSKMKYLLLLVIPIVFLGLSIDELLTSEPSNLIIGFSIIWNAYLIWIVIDYFRNNNQFEISEHGVRTSKELIPWEVIFATVIKESQYENRLILILPTGTDIDINLNGLIGPKQRIENYIELYRKKRMETE